MKVHYYFFHRIKIKYHSISMQKSWNRMRKPLPTLLVLVSIYIYNLGQYFCLHSMIRSYGQL